MKNTLLLALAVAGTMTATSGFAQGTISFGNNGTSLVTTNNGTTAGSAPLTTTSQIKVALLYQNDPNGSLAPTALTFANGSLGNWKVGPVLANIAPSVGRFGAGTETTDNSVAPSGNVWVEVVAWNGNFTTLAAALAGATYWGNSGVFSQGTGDGGSAPAVPIVPTTGVANAGSFSGLVLTPVPEPSTIALGGLGAAALLLFRRRK